MPTLDFKGKQLVYAHHLTVSARTLKIDAKKSTPPPPPPHKPGLDGNLIIHGDNLHALKALMPRYAGRVNCIYIDPPYNTGNEKWLYNDNVNSPMMKEWLKNKSPVDGEDLERHDKWLCMMWPRLQLLRELLAEDGVIFISIDDNEQHRLRMMMDEIFGEESFVASFLWKKKGTSTNVKGATVSPLADYQLCYRKSNNGSINPRIKSKKTRKYPHRDGEGNYRIEIIEKKNVGTYKRDTMRFKILGKTPRKGKRWQMGEKTANELEKNNRFIFEEGMVQRKIYDFEDKDTTSANPSYLPENCGSSDSANKSLISILGKHDFENPKPSTLIVHLLKLATSENAIVIDSFAGSGTTAHAVLALNKEDGGNRKFILVECEDYAHKITAERVRRVIKGVPKSKDENLKNGLGGTFTYCTLGDEISIEKMLTGKHLPDYETFARHLVYVATGKSPDKIRKARGNDGFFLETPDRLFYLIYEPKLTFLRSVDSALNGDRAGRIAKQAKTKNKPALVFATHKFMGQKELTDMGIVFCGLPYGKVDY